jgi:peroxiredoxin Q/BCP
LKKILNLLKWLGFFLNNTKKMPLRMFSKAPDFTLQTADNEAFNLKDALKESKVLLFFYPKSFTAGCTTEACDFRNDYTFFTDRNIRVVGISHDTEETQARFARRYQLPYTLLSDPGRTVCRLYDAVFPFGLLTKRVTYLIDQQGIIELAYENLFNAEDHLLQMKNRIENLEKESGSIKVK